MTEHLDVAVIGSGFGGLTAGALAARSGLRVALFEQHTRPGGCAGDFAMDGFTFPAGATVVTGLEPGGILRRVAGIVGAAMPSVALDPSLVFHVEGRIVPYDAGHAAWRDTFGKAFPDAGPGYARFWEWVRTTGGAVYGVGRALPSLPLHSLADVRRTLPAARPGALRALPALIGTVAGAKARLGAVGSPAADALIDALLLDATGARATECSAVQGAIALDLYRRGCQWVEGGTGRLAMALVRAIRAHGGDVRFRARVLHLAPRRDGWELTFESGETVYARRVVANVPPVALAHLRGERGTPTRNSEAWGAFVLHLGIDASGLDAIHPFHQVVRATGPALEDEGNNCLVSCFPARGDRWALSVSTHTRAGSWRTARASCLPPPPPGQPFPSLDSPFPSPDPRRRVLEDRLIDAVATVIPSVRERILLRRSATPATFERFTLRPGGFVGGLIQRPSVTALRAAGHRPAGGLFLAGDHVFPGQGIVGVALSGINAYRDAIESLGRKAIL